MRFRVQRFLRISLLIAVFLAGVNGVLLAGMENAAPGFQVRAPNQEITAQTLTWLASQKDDGRLPKVWIYFTDKQIFDATAPGVGTSLSDALDANVASACDVSESLCPGSEADKITIGAVTGQANGTLNINGNTTFALRFKVKVK